MFKALAAFLAVCFVSTAVWSAESTFAEIGFLPGYQYSNSPMSMTDDGSTVVGWSISSDSGRAPYLWRRDAGIAPLSDFIDGVDSGTLETLHISGDGQSIFLGDAAGVARWTTSGGVSPLFDSPAGTDGTVITGSSADGTVLTGNLVTQPGSGLPVSIKSFVWRDGIGLNVIDDGFIASGISGNGGFLVGSRVAEPDASLRQAIRRSIDGTETVVVTAMASGDALAASYDGAAVVGIARVDGFRWTTAEGALLLGFLTDQNDATTALDVSADGSIVVGYAEGAPQGAFIWDAAHGMRSIHQVLIDEGVDVSGRRLASANHVSADGRIVVGSEFLSNGGGTGAWVATIVPEPNALPLAAFASCLFLVWTRFRRT